MRRGAELDMTVMLSMAVVVFAIISRISRVLKQEETAYDYWGTGT